MRGETLPPELADAVRAELDRLGPFGRAIRYVDEVGSTNDVAAGLAAAGAAEGTTVVAAAQTAGRGRRGRAWWSPPGAGIYLSVILRPPLPVPTLVTLASGVAVADAIRRATGLAAELKWPNDIGTGRPWRKVGGLLAEASSTAHGLEWVVLGIGVNVRAAAVPPALAARATALELELGRPVDQARLLVEMLVELGAVLGELRSGGARRVLDRWRALAPGCEGRLVEWDADGGRLRGLTAGVDDEGGLWVQVGPTRHRIVAGEVRWL
jgi:BirA family biotin operon repressor/biotin-[acetyl-CoA-carboxylase] ligase